MSATMSWSEGEFGPDLWGLICDLGVPLVGATPVMTIPSPQPDRACFRLTFADGRVLKGRRAKTAAAAERIGILSSFLDPRVFPPVLARRGRALLTEWIDGTALRPDDCSDELVRTCGRVQAALHRLVLSPSTAKYRLRTPDWERWLDAALRELEASEVFDLPLATAIRRLAVRHAPRATHTGLCHGDFCAENIVLSTAGSVWVVDNDNLAVDAYEHDLARTWYRWPMAPGAEEAFAAGYGQSDQGRNFAEHFLHWALLVLVESCRFRAKAGAASLGVPLGRLRAVLESEGLTERLPRLLATAR